MKLTVAIPTYKRPQLLEKCVRSVLASIGDHDAEILVCDDSVDHTNDAVYAALDDARLRVIRNASNLGIDANICACIERSAGDYVWLIGEDDLMRRSGITAVLEKIDALPDVPFIYVNYSYITADQVCELRHRSIDEDRATLPFESFVDEHLWSAGFIGGCVINRRQFVQTAYRNFIGTYYAHVAGITLASAGKSIGLIGTPQIGNRVGNADTFTWSTDSFGVFQGWRVLLKGLKATLGDAHYQRAYLSHIKAHGYLSYKFLIAKKADNLLSDESVRMLQAADTSDSEQARIRVVARYLPAALCRLARRIYAGLRRQSLASFSLS